MTHPMYVRLEKMKVFLTSNPIAMMSFVFSLDIRSASSMSRFFHNVFSSSVNWITSATSKASCNHLKIFHHSSDATLSIWLESYFVTMNGTR